jgi:hypothetical protein
MTAFHVFVARRFAKDFSTDNGIWEGINFFWRFEMHCTPHGMALVMIVGHFDAVKLHCIRRSSCIVSTKLRHRTMVQDDGGPPGRQRVTHKMWCLVEIGMAFNYIYLVDIARGRGHEVGI